MEKVVVDSERCLRCGACISVAPNNFTYGDDGESVVTDTTVTEEVKNAIDMCPVSAISIENDESKVVDITKPAEEDIEEAA